MRVGTIYLALPSFKCTLSSGYFWPLLGALGLIGCTADLGRFPDSSFNEASRLAHASSAVQTDQLPVTDSPATFAASKSRLNGLLNGLPNGSQGALVDDTDSLLQRYRSRTSDSDSTSADDAVAQFASSDSNENTPAEVGTSAAEATFSLEAFDTSLSALLFSLAVDAGFQLQVNGLLNTRVTINAIDQPLGSIMRSIALQSNIAWQIRDNTLLVWAGDSYSNTYSIDYLNIQRRTESSVGLATQVGTINALDAAGGSIANSSRTLVENTSEHHFWVALQDDLSGIVNQSQSGESGLGQFSINKEAGLITVHAQPGVHNNVQRYLDSLQKSSQRQVLIEATVVEVALSDRFDAGVDWQLLANGVSGISAAQVLIGAPLVSAETIDRQSAPAGLVSFVQQGSNGDLSATLSLLEQFGDVRILSKPRIIALNNQSSVLKVVDNRVYFTVNVQRRQTEEDDEIVTETEIHTVPVGLVMNVTPQISEHGMVMLNVRPTLSRILGFVNDPNPELALADISNGVPEIQVREMETMLRVRSGSVAIIGGLMQETQSENDTRLPGLGKLPGIGRLFSKQNRESRQTELLIVLRPTVLTSQNAAKSP